MGRTALFLVMGLGMAMGYIGFQMYRASENASTTQYAYLKYMQARNLARASIHAALRTYDRPPGQTPSVHVNTNFNNGYFRLDSLQTSVNGDTVHMVSTGVYAESTYTMKVTLFRDTRPFPMPNSAIGIRASPVSFSMTGAQAEVDGHNYDETGTTEVGSGDLPGVTTMTATDSANVLAIGGSRIEGSVAVQKDTTTPNPGAYINEYLNNYDYYYTSGSIPNPPGNQWGSSTNPVVVVCDSPSDTNYSCTINGNVTGYGVLVVKGNLVLGGTFNWYGLVICYGESNTVTFKENGTPGIVGGLILANPSGGAATLALKGSGSQGKVRYSSAAIQKARNIGRLRFYTILDWYE
ncbi:MAG: hypothetical protein HY088_01795 [Ignavibacteriales bacterium]|nr:hypothetical protein [Ignavibacteriales bacterium]